jgi:hypothetical protein
MERADESMYDRWVMGGVWATSVGVAYHGQMNVCRFPMASTSKLHLSPLGRLWIF